MKVIFVGDKPSGRMQAGAKAFQGAVCETRLHEWIKALGVLDYEIVNQVDLFVASPTYVTHTFDGVTMLLPIRARYIALGNNAAKALKYGPKHFKLPHPSGQNRQMNDASYIEKCLQAAKAYLNETDY